VILQVTGGGLQDLHRVVAGREMVLDGIDPIRVGKPGGPAEEERAGDLVEDGAGGAAQPPSELIDADREHVRVDDPRHPHPEVRQARASPLYLDLIQLVCGDAVGGDQAFRSMGVGDVSDG